MLSIVIKQNDKNNQFWMSWDNRNLRTKDVLNKQIQPTRWWNAVFSSLWQHHTPSSNKHTFWDNHCKSIQECQRVISFLTNSKPTISLSFTCGIFPIHLMTPNVGWPPWTATSTIVPSSKPGGTSMFVWPSTPENNKRTTSVERHNMKIWKAHKSSHSNHVDNQT